MSLNLLENFPYPSPRQIQVEVLEQLEKHWHDYDVFVLVMPTASGKTALARTLQKALYSVSAITPTNQLVGQYLDEFPDTPTLHRLDSYYCEKWDRPCPITRAKTRNFCNTRRDGCNCPAASDLSIAKYRSGPGIYNYYTYLSHKLYREILVVDESHNLIPTIRDRQSLIIWKHDYNFPRNMYTREQMQEWIQTLPTRTKKHKKIKLLDEATRFDVPMYIAQRTEEQFNGKGTQRGSPEMRDCIKLSPVDISSAPPMFWPPGQVNKIVLMSATIGEKDLEQLGLGRKRTLVVECQSPIPIEGRPIVAHCSVVVNRNRIEEAAVELSNEIMQIAEYYKGTKGVVHATYQLSGLLKEYLTDGRFLFHTRESKAEVYKQFREKLPESGAVLVACGMYEGIDLPDDLGRWQVISKIPWPSLGSPAVKHLSDLDPDWYLWETAKITMQACGRISRNPTDVGDTIILDKSFHKLYNEAERLLPNWFKEAIIWP